MKVFADAFFYVALINRRDEHHTRVMAWADAFEGFAVLSEDAATHVVEVTNPFRSWP